MVIFLFKSILGLILFLAGFLAVLSMFNLMGRSDLKISANFLRRFHRASGFVFSILLLIRLTQIVISAK